MFEMENIYIIKDTRYYLTKQTPEKNSIAITLATAVRMACQLINRQVPAGMENNFCLDKQNFHAVGRLLAFTP